MNGKAIAGVLLALVLVGMGTLACVLPLGLGLIVTRGVSSQVQYVPVVAPVPEVPVMPRVQPPQYWPGAAHAGPFGAGSGVLRCLLPLALVVLVFALLRRGPRHRHWGPPGGHGGPGAHRGHGVPPWLEEWHRRAHSGQVPPEPGPGAHRGHGVPPWAEEWHRGAHAGQAPEAGPELR